MGYLTGGHPENDQALTRPQYVPATNNQKSGYNANLVQSKISIFDIDTSFLVNFDRPTIVATLQQFCEKFQRLFILIKTKKP